MLFFAFLLAFASQHVGQAFNRLTQVERWVRLITGLVFILAGFYYSLTYVYGFSLLHLGFKDATRMDKSVLSKG